MERKGRVSVGFSGCQKNGHIPGGPIWMIQWLPNGYAITEQDRLLGVFFDTDGLWGEYGLKDDTLPPLLRTVKAAIERHILENPEDAAGHLSSKDWQR